MDNLIPTPGWEVWLGVNRKEILLIYITRDSAEILCHFRGILAIPRDESPSHLGVYFHTQRERLNLCNWSCIETSEIEVLWELSNIINEFNKMLVLKHIFLRHAGGIADTCDTNNFWKAVQGVGYGNFLRTSRPMNIKDPMQRSRLLRIDFVFTGPST